MVYILKILLLSDIMWPRIVTQEMLIIQRWENIQKKYGQETLEDSVYLDVPLALPRKLLKLLFGKFT